METPSLKLNWISLCLYLHKPFYLNYADFCFYTFRLLSIKLYNVLSWHFQALLNDEIFLKLHWDDYHSGPFFTLILVSMGGRPEIK